MIYFDMDIYEPTKYVLEKVKPHICKGTIIGFDEACNEKFPNLSTALIKYEPTLAGTVTEVAGLDTFSINDTEFCHSAPVVKVEYLT